MYCKYCGQETKTNSSICNACLRKQGGLSRPKSTKPFYLIALSAPVLSILESLLSCIDMLSHATTGWSSVLLRLPISSVVFILLIFWLVSRKKIDTSCFCREDAIIWCGGALLRFLPTGNMITSMIGSYYGINVLAGFSAYSVMLNVLSLPSVWYYVCLTVFLLVRSGTVCVKKKVMLFLALGFIAFSVILAVFAPELVRLFVASLEVLPITVALLRPAAMFLWLRHLVLLWFAILMGQKKLGFSGGTVCLAGFWVIPFMVSYICLLEDYLAGIGFSATIGCAVSGIVLLGAKLLNFLEKRYEEQF